MSNLAKNTLIYLVGNIVNRIGAFVMLPIYTNYLTISEYGILELIYTTTSVLAVMFGAGLAHTTLRFYFDTDDAEKRKSVINTNLLTALTLSSIGGIIVLIFSKEIAVLLFDSADNRHFIYFAVAIMLFELLNEIYYAYIRANEKAVLFVTLSAARLIVQIVSTTSLVVFMGYAIDGVLISNLLSVSVVFIVLMVYVTSKCGVKIQTSIIKPVLNYSIPFALSSMLAAIMVNADKVLLKYYHGLDAVGIYGLAVKFSLIMSFLLIEPYQKSYGPYRFSIMNQPSANKTYADITYYVFLLSLLLLVGLSLFTPNVLFMMSSDVYWISFYLVPILSFGIVFQALNYSFQTGILIGKKTKFLVKITLISAAFNLFFNYFLIPKYSYFGAAVVNCLTFLLMSVLTNNVSQKIRQVNYDYKKMIAPVVAMFVVVSYIYFIKQEQTILDVFTKLVLICMYALSILFFDKKLRMKFYMYLSIFRKSLISKLFNN